MAVNERHPAAAADALLAAYERSQPAPGEHEAAMVADCRRFIAAHEDCLWRTCLEGHLTGSAWIVSPDRTQVLLVHHRKLNRWLQPGGHADGDSDLAAVARREAWEETGVAAPRLARPDLFDFDRHRIPARGAEPEHWHYDFRFLIEADPAAPVVVSEESHEVKWFPLADIGSLTSEASLLRLAHKTQ